MVNSTLFFAGMLVLILVAAGSSLLYDHQQQRQLDQNRLHEIKGRLMIIQNLDNQTNQRSTINKKNKNIDEDSSKRSIDDQPRKEEKYFVVQEGGNLSKNSSAYRITIQELKVVKDLSSEETIFSNPASNSARRGTGCVGPEPGRRQLGRRGDPH